MKLFDCYATFGRPTVPPPEYALNAPDLIAEMDYCGISEALVYHIAMKEMTPLVGNPLLMDQVKDEPRLHPTWAILPEQTGEQPPPDQFIRLMKDNHVRALYAFPEEHGYYLNGTTFGGLLEEMIEHHIPLLMRVDYALFGSILKEFPKLTLIGVGHGPHGQERFFRPLMEAYANFYIDTSAFLLEGGIEDHCGKYGAERLLFSTGYPRNCIGGPVLRILTAEISNSDKDLVAHGNLERVLKEVRL